MKYHSKKRKHRQKNLLFITIDVLSLIPVFLVYVLVRETSGYTVEPHQKEFARIQTLPRFYRVIIYFTKLRNTAGLNQLFIVCMYLLIRIFFLTIIGACIWHACEMGEVHILKYLKQVENEPVKAEDWFALSYLKVGNLFLHAFPPGNNKLILIRLKGDAFAIRAIKSKHRSHRVI